MNIGEKQIGTGAPAYIIAEIGVNHDGRVERALRLTRAAASAGADAVKLQHFQTDRLMSGAAKLAGYQRAAGESDPVEMLRRLELDLDDMGQVVSLAHGLGLHAIVTVFSVELIGEARQLEWDAYKTASPDIIHLPLLRGLAATGKPLIVSTGAATPDEVADARRWLADMDDRLAFLQCVSSYPTPIEQAGIGGMAAIEELTRCPVGYSDHTRETATGALARRFGAAILEKHLTYDTRAAGPDHAASLAPDQFAEYVRLVRRTAVLPREERLAAFDSPGRRPVGVGGSEKRVLEVERDVRAVSRQSLVLTRDVVPGHRLTREDLTIKRPGTGVPPGRFEETIGRVVRRAVRRDMPLTDDAFEGAAALAGA